MKTTKLVPFLMIPALATACASSEPTADGSSDITAKAGVELTSAVGAVVIDGRRVCTAALVDVDAGASINGTSLSGRQVVMGGACIGRLRNGFLGGAVFVTEHNNVSLATPIISVDLQSQASAGLAVGILSDRQADTVPMRILGADAAVNAGVHSATILRADDNGLLVAAGVEVHAGVKFDLVTKCSDFHFAARAGAQVGAGFSLSDDGLGAAAIVKVNGELRFAANIDAGCVVREVGGAVALAADATLEAGNAIGDSIALIGASGTLAAVYGLPAGRTTLAFRVFRNTTEIDLSAQGRLAATTSSGISCSKDLGLLGPCRLHGNFQAGEVFNVTVDTFGDILPDHPNDPGKTRVYFTLAN
jgi:hypothetical protein